MAPKGGTHLPSGQILINSKTDAEATDLLFSGGISGTAPSIWKVVILVLKVLDVLDSGTDPLSTEGCDGSPFAAPPPGYLHVS